MHFKKGYELRDVCGELVLVPDGMEGIDLTAMLHLNESTAEIYRNFEGRDFTIEDVVAFLLDNYDVDAVQVQKDVESLFEKLCKNGGIEE